MVVIVPTVQVEQLLYHPRPPGVREMVTSTIWFAVLYPRKCMASKPLSAIAQGHRHRQVAEIGVLAARHRVLAGKRDEAASVVRVDLVGKGWCGSGPPRWCLRSKYFGMVLS